MRGSIVAVGVRNAVNAGKVEQIRVLDLKRSWEEKDKEAKEDVGELSSSTMPPVISMVWLGGKAYRVHPQEGI